VAELPASALTGRRVVITRATAQSDELVAALRAQGAEAILAPLIRTVALEDYRALDAALLRLGPRDWILLTSQNAAAPVFARARALGRDFRETTSGILLAAVGPATAKAAHALGVKVDYVAHAHDGVSLANELAERLRGRLVLLPRSDLAGSDLPAAIKDHGGQAIEALAYRTERVHEWEGRLGDMILEGAVDAVVCFSPSAVGALTDLLGRRCAANVRDKLVFAAIGDVTAEAFRKAGVRQPLVALNASAAAVVKVLGEHFVGRQQSQIAGVKHL
jgi:uroporphyrinogen-III synthase